MKIGEWLLVHGAWLIKRGLLLILCLLPFHGED